MKCHYEVLGVTRNVTNDDLKKAYRKLALKWHPDKNLDSTEEAKEQFQLVQQAWEVLSDPHERAWYDNHREAILKGGIGENYKDDSIDLFQYFSTTCFKGYGDDEKGFYTVYRKVFETLAAEDTEFTKEVDSDEEVPGFGDSRSSYEDIVHNFYAYWQSYSTKRSFAWLDPYDIRETPNRRVLRIVEKENKKVRDKAKRERNEQVRNLVAFVRKRDKRVQAHAAKLAERAKENFEKAEQFKKQQLLERQRQLKEHKESEWSKFSNIEAELKNIEANLAREFGEDSSDRDSEEDEAIDDNTLYCVACNKIFKTHKAFTNHENSRKHKNNVISMKASMVEEDNEFNSSEDSDVSSQSTSTCDKKLATDSQMPDFLLNPGNNSPPTVSNDRDELSDDELMSDVEDSESPSRSEKKASKLEGVTFAVGPQMDNALFIAPSKIDNDDDYVASEDELISDQEDDDAASTKKQKKKKRRKKNVQNPVIEQASDEEDKSLDEDNLLSKKQRKKHSNNTVTEKTKGKKAKDARTMQTQAGRESRSKKKVDAQMADVADLGHCCVSCKSEFPSKNKLFEHLKRTGHSVYIPDSVKNKKNEDRPSKGKGNSDKKSH